MVRYLEKNREYEQVSRYQVLRVIEDHGQTYLETYNQKFVPKSDDDVYHIVKHSEVNRLDIISENYYGSPDYWWAIALANNMIDPFVVSEGVMLRLPPMTTLNASANEILTR